MGKRSGRWSKPPRSLALSVAGFLVSLWSPPGAAWNCTQADSTYSCCLKKHPENPNACGDVSATSGTTSASGKVVAGAAVGTAVIAATASSDERMKRNALILKVDEVLKECANLAQAEVNLKRFGTKPPTAQQCSEVVERLGNGKVVTRAMALGTEKHEVALRCAREKLGQLVPGMFGIEQRYLYDLKTHQKRPISQEEVNRLLAQGRKGELLGSLVPDVVIHAPGNLLAIIAVYDFKFPCPISNEPEWGEYPSWHPYHLRSQGQMYQEAFEVPPALVAPWYGVLR